tara:strand:- start:350 stop:646 length:297 start_codon:yes stop_codon:yes gene_type:complete
MRLEDLIDTEKQLLRTRTESKLRDNQRAINSHDFCLVCSKPKNEFEFVKHHIQYEPEEVIAFVHYECHREIHDGKRPDLIQYTREERERFYGVKKHGL